MGFESKTKDPDAVLDYRWEWQANGWLTAGDTITDATFTVYTVTGETLPDSDTTPVDVDSYSFTDTDATAWVSGGTLGEVYLVTCHVETAQGRADDRSLKIKVIEK